MRPLRFGALAGLVLVAVVGLRAAPGLAALLLMLAVSVAVPLGLDVALQRGDGGVPGRVVPFVAPVAAIVAVLGFLDPPGTSLAIGAACVHALSCGLAGLVAVVRAWHRRHDRFGPLPEAAMDAGLLFLPPASVWLLASRSASSLMGFVEPVVTFTAAHFHVAGFAAPVVLGGVGRLVAGHAQRRYVVATLSVCAGVPLTAIGIATSPRVEAASAVLLACGMLVASTVLVATASRLALPRSRIAAALFVVSGATLLLTMTLAASFALTSSAGRGSSLAGIVPLGTMIAWHGAANAIGFALAGLTALTLLSSRTGR